jgi:bifunctional non-homologous end joining protein LigD
MRFSGMLKPPNCGRACSVAFVPPRAHSRYASMLVFARACEMGLEEIVSKRAGSRYSSGNSRQWLKSKKLVFDPLHVAAFGLLIPGTHGAKDAVVGLGQPHFAPS